MHSQPSRSYQREKLNSSNSKLQSDSLFMTQVTLCLWKIGTKTKQKRRNKENHIPSSRQSIKSDILNYSRRKRWIFAQLQIFHGYKDSSGIAQCQWQRARLVIKRLQVQVLAGVAREFYSPGSCSSTDSYFGIHSTPSVTTAAHKRSGKPHYVSNQMKMALQ